MEYGMEDFWYGTEMEWKKMASMEYGKIGFQSIPYHALVEKCIKEMKCLSKLVNLKRIRNARRGSGGEVLSRWAIFKFFL